MATSEPNGKNEYTTVTIKRSTKDKLDRIGGSTPSYDSTIGSMADVVQRERLVEKVRRGILGVAEAVEDAAGRITHDSGRGPKKPGPPAAPE
jgi:hypothetical protein